jgi:hypothetical protein
MKTRYLGIGINRLLRRHSSRREEGGGKRKTLFHLTAATLLASMALTVQPVTGDGVATAAAADVQTTGLLPQEFTRATGPTSKEFWFPALYGDTAKITGDNSGAKVYTSSVDATTAIDSFTFNWATATDFLYDSVGVAGTDSKIIPYPGAKAQGGTFVQKIEPTSPFSYKVKIIDEADPDGKVGTVRLVDFEAMKGIFAKDHVLFIPEFVWATYGGKYLIYKVTEINPDILSKVAKFSGQDTLYNGFYFGSSADTDTTRHLSDSTLAVAAASGGVWKKKEALTNEPFIDTITVTTLVPKSSTGTPIEFYGLVKHKTSDNPYVAFAPTRYTGEDVTPGSAIFDGFVAGADKVANQLRFGMTDDARDKTIDKTDISNLVTLLGKVDSIRLHLEGSDGKQKDKTDSKVVNGDKVPYLVELATDAFAVDSLAKRFSTLSFGRGLTGDLGKAGFGKVKGHFKKITFWGDEYEQADKFYGKHLTLSGKGLFAGNNIDTLLLPKYLTEIGEEWFKGDTIGVVYNTTLTKVTTIGKSAFEGAQIPYLGQFGFNKPTSAYKEGVKPLTWADDKIVAVKTIGERAFYGATIGPDGTATKDSTSLDSLRYVTAIGDSAFANAKTWLNIKGLAYLESVGKGAFAGDTLYVDTIAHGDIKQDILEGSATGIIVKLADTFLTTLPAKIFDGATLIPENASKGDTISGKDAGIYLSEAAEPSSGIDPDAFKDANVYVPFAKLEAWKAILKGAKKVIAYGAPKKTDGELELLVRVVKANGNPSGYFDQTKGRYEFSYGNEVANLRLNFYNAAKANYAYYAITGPKGAEGLGLLTGSSDNVKTDMNPVKEDGIDLPKPLPAGLYSIYLDGPIATKPDTILLYVKPTSLDDYKVATLSHTWVGNKANVEKLLKTFTVDKLNVTDTTTGQPLDVSKDAIISYEDIDDKALNDKVGKADSVKIGTLRGNGNLTGELPVWLKYTKFDLSNATVNDIEEVSFSGGKQSYPYKGTYTVKNGDYDISKYVGYTTQQAAVKAGEEGTILFTANGDGKVGLEGEQTATYKLTATWDVLASYNPDDVLEGTKQYDGSLYNLQGAITLPFLSAEDYTIVAAEHQTGEITTVDELEQLDFLPGADYDIYIIPAGSKAAEYAEKDPNAVYAGTLEYTLLPLEVLKSAFHVERASVAPAAPEDEEGEEGEESEEPEGEEPEALTEDLPYVLVLDRTIYNGNASWIYDADDKAFTVTVPKEVAQYVATADGEPFEGTFTVEVPSLPAEELTFVAHDAEGNEVAFTQKSLHAGESYDLSKHLKADPAAKFEFLDDVEWTIEGAKKGQVTLDDKGVVTAVAEWQGVTVTATVAETGATASIAIVVLADDEEPESVASVTAAKRSVVYADGKLTLKGFGGTTATLYRLNGKAAARLNVVSEDAAYTVKLTKGFYLVKAGTTVTKIVVK